MADADTFSGIGPVLQYLYYRGAVSDFVEEFLGFTDTPRPASQLIFSLIYYSMQAAASLHTGTYYV